MLKSNLRRFSVIALALPLALGLAACEKENPENAGLSGEPIAKIAAPAGKAWADTIVKTEEGGYRMGNPDAPIKLVEYASYTCSHCAEVAEQGGAALRDEFVASGRVSFELRNFVRDPFDLSAALLVRCGAPESFFALSEQAFANQKAMFQTVEKADKGAMEAIGNLAPDKRLVQVGQLAGLTDFFAARGVAKDQANACLANVAEAEAVSKRTQEQGEKYKIEGTPTFLVNGSSIGSMGWAELRSRLQSMGAR